MKVLSVIEAFSPDISKKYVPHDDAFLLRRL